jgi:hypothetical protein
MSILYFKTESDPVPTENEMTLVNLTNVAHSIFSSDVWKYFFDDIISPEMDLFLFDVFKYLGTLYPDEPDFDQILTEEEINDAMIAAAKIIDYQPDYKFLKKWSASLPIPDDQRAREEFKWKIKDLESYSYRRKYFGSYTGYKLIFSSMGLHGSVYIAGNYGTVVNRLYNRRFRLVDTGQSLFDNVLWPSHNWPDSGYIEGLTDFIYFRYKFLTFDSGLKFDEQDENNAYVYQFDSAKSLQIDRTLFLELTLDRLLYHQNTLGISGACLCDIDWLDYVDNLAQKSKRAIESPVIGAQLNLVTDISGFYTPTELEYTHPNIQARFIVIPAYYKDNKTPSYIQLGTGGAINESFFKKPSDLIKADVYGEGLYGKSLYSSPNISISENEIDLSLGAKLENAIFEAPIGDYENYDDIGDSYSFIHSAIYCQAYKDVLMNEQQTYKVTDSGILDGADLFDVTAPVNGLSEANQKSIVDNITNVIYLPRKFISKGSVRLVFRIAPNLKSPVDELSGPSLLTPDLSAWDTGIINSNFFTDLDGTTQWFKVKISSDSTDERRVYYDESFPATLPALTDTSFWLEGVPLPDEADRALWTSWNDYLGYYFYISDLTDPKNLSNPLWQYVVLEDYFDTFAKMWRQRARVFQHEKIITKVGVFYRLKEITEDASAPYVKVFTSWGYDIDDNLEKWDKFYDYKTGEVRFVLVPNVAGLFFSDSDVFEANHNSEGAIQFLGKNRFNVMAKLTKTDHDAFTTVTTPLSSFVNPSLILSMSGNFIANFIVNTTRDFSNSLDKKSSIVAITEMGIFNSDDQMIAYATFPPVIYNSFNHHLAINAFIRTKLITV